MRQLGLVEVIEQILRHGRRWSSRNLVLIVLNSCEVLEVNWFHLVVGLIGSVVGRQDA